MSIFKMIYSYIYYLFVKMTYHLHEDNEKELIYHKNNKYIIVVKNVETGKLLYEVVKNLNNLTIRYIPVANFKFSNYGISRKNTVRWFSIEGGVTGEWKEFSNPKQLKIIQYFVETMQEKGLVLDDTKFNNSGCRYVSEFLSFFIQSNEKDKIKLSKGCMIKYIHYVFSDGGNLNDFYQSLEDNALYEGYNIPYNSPIATMCYNYFKAGVTPYSILDILERAVFSEYSFFVNPYPNYSLVAIPDKFEDKFTVTEKTDEYTIYDGIFKIYQNPSSEYQKFCVEGTNIAKSEMATLEKIEAVIVDLNNQVIGYKYANLDEPNVRAVFNPNSQKGIFKYVENMVKYLARYNTGKQNSKTTDFLVEDALVYKGFSRGNYVFKCKTVKDFFNLNTNNWTNIKYQVTVIFFKILADYMKNKYGELTSEEQFLEKYEIRYLSPVVAREFVNFVLGRQVYYLGATEEFFKLLDNRAASNDFCYDARFCYNPTTVHFAFDYEAEKKYNVKFEKGTTEKLPDGRTVVTFKKSKNISAYVEREKTIREDVLSAIKTEDEHVKLLGITEIILGTDRLNTSNMYNVIGYVSEPLKGEPLTDAVLLKLNNRDLLKVASYLFSKFSTRYIPGENIWMDTDFKFYINYMSQEFQVKRCEEGVKHASTFVQSVFNYLVSVGYNPNAFVGWTVPNGGFKATRQYLLDLAIKFNEYCNEHKIYYNSNKGPCPVCERTKYRLPYAFDKRFAKVFEDAVAVHYKISTEYNLKVYKPEYINQQETAVDMQASLRLVQDTSKYFHQDCFLPIKKALDTDNQFVGYIYKAESFEALNGNISDVCVDFVDGNKLNNLARLKSLIRLILQVKEITNQKYGFSINPFSHVFLNPSHKRQVQILNIDFIAPCNSKDIMQTKQWTCDYIYKVLETDSTIEVKRSALPEGLDLILSKLTELAGLMTKRCSIHNIYYKSSYMCCPKCVPPEKQPKNTRYTQKENFTRKSSIKNGEGGEAFIYECTNDTVAKVFKEKEFNKEFKSSVLFRISMKKDLLEKVNQEGHKFKYVYPKEILIDSTTGEIFGYVMDWVRNAYPIADLKDKVKTSDLRLSKEDIFEIIITIGEGIEALHKLNIYIGDLNGRNILFDDQKNVYFLDFDGMGVDEITPEFCTDGYIDPLSKKNRCITMKDDWYSFAIQAFYYLTYTHPFNGIIKRNGKTVKLDITQKMEQRISLLGDHGMSPPDIAESWDWMNVELKNAFLNIFEGDSRESIVPYLKHQYQALSQSVNEQSFNKIYRINSKFIATEIEAFEGNVVRVINPHAAVCENGRGKYVAILVKSDNQIKEFYIKFNGSVERIKYVFFSDDWKIAYIVHDTANLTVIDIEADKILYNKQISDATNVVVNDRTIYYTGISNGKSVIFKRTIQPNGELLRETIVFGTNRIKKFNVEFNTKFILITQAAQTIDEVYCNSQKFCAFEYKSEDMAKRANYKIIYDEVTKSWLIVNNFGKGVVIQMSGESTEVDISKYVNNANFANIYFVKNNIYIPTKEAMYIINVISKEVKRMECCKIMAPESQIYNVNSSGFSVITQNILYEVRKG